MLALGVLKNGEYKNPETLTEALEGEDIIQIIEKDEDIVIPNSWLEYYNNRINRDLLSNPHNYLNEPVKKYNKIINFISQFEIQEKFYPSRCQIDINKNLSLDFLLSLDFDYILLPDKTRIISRKNKKSFVPLCIENSIRFSIENQKFVIDKENGILKTIINLKEGKNFYNIYSESDILKKYNYQGTISRWISKRWNIMEFANIITNHSIISEFCCIEETSHCIGKDKKKRIKIIFENLFSKTEPILFLNYSSDHLTIKIRNCPCPEEYNIIAHLFICILQVYQDTIPEKDEINYNLLSVLRIINPELFIENYTRECSILPIPLISEENSNLKNILYNHIFPDQKIDYSKAIEYPLGSGNYYTAPEDYFPGLKRNRLKNKDKYKYIVTCYKKNHLKNPRSETYNFFYSNSSLKKNHSLEECILEAGCKKKDDINVYDCVLFQDIYNQEINSEQISSFQDHLLYRYYEEIYNINIILLDYSSVYISKCPKPYFWDYNNKRDVIFINKKSNNNFYLLQIDKSIQKKWIKRKESVTQRSQINYNYKNVTSQFVDINGKRRMILENNVWKESIGAPLNLPHEDYVNKDLLESESISKSIHKKLNIPNKLNVSSNRKFLVY